MVDQLRMDNDRVDLITFQLLVGDSEIILKLKTLNYEITHINTALRIPCEDSALFTNGYAVWMHDVKESTSRHYRDLLLCFELIFVLEDCILLLLDFFNHLDVTLWVHDFCKSLIIEMCRLIDIELLVEASDLFIKDGNDNHALRYIDVQITFCSLPNIPNSYFLVEACCNHHQSLILHFTEH